MQQPKSRPNLYIVGLGACEVDVPEPAAPPAQVTQDQLVEILTLEKELELIRRRLLVKRLKVAAALMGGATVEAGRHEAIYDTKRNGPGRLTISAFTGGIVNKYAIEGLDSDKCLFKPSFAMS